MTYGNGVFLSRQALAELPGARVIDLRWLAPLPEDALLAAVGDTPDVLIVDECRVTGSQSEALMAFFTERTPGKRVSRIAAEDSFIPLGRGATLTLPSRESIVAAARKALSPSGERVGRGADVSPRPGHAALPPSPGLSPEGERET